MDRRSLISGALGGAAGVVVGRELVPSSAGAAADVDRSEFEALKAQVEYLAQFHPPMPAPHVPKFSGTVSLPAGFVVPFGETWDFDPNVSTTVEVGANVVVAGTLQMRPANPGVAHTLRFVGINEAAFIGGGMEPVDSDVGLWVIGAGVLDAVGSPKTSWTRAAEAVASGVSAVALSSSPSGWQQGDTITVVPTERGVGIEYSGHSTRYDTRQVQGIDGTTVALSSATQWTHPAVDLAPGFTATAEVLNLTRNVVIEGTPTGRAHVFIASSVAHQLANIEIRHMGPRKINTATGFTQGVAGRYPLHFHMQGDASRGSVIKDVVVHSCGHRGFVPHQSHGITLDGCVVHDSYDSGFWWDPSPSFTDDCVWTKCVASMIAPVPVYTGNGMGAFVLGRGDRNQCIDCVAVGVRGGRNASGFVWPEGDWPTIRSIWLFERNVTHNNDHTGIFVWQNTDAVHLVEDFVVYHCNGNGITHGAYGNPYHYRNGFIVGCNVAALFIQGVSNMGNALLTFEAIRADAGGVTNVVRFDHHNRFATLRTVLAGCEFVGSAGAEIATSCPIPNKPDLVDVIDCGPAVDITLNQFVHPDSVFRVQNGTNATQITPTGTTGIVPFSTTTYATPQPFALVTP